MKAPIVGTIMVLLSIGLVAQQPACDPKQLDDADVNFTDLAWQQGVKAAFLATMDKEAIVLSPEPTNARKHYEAKKEDSGFLYWLPTIDRISGSCDLGWTSGPWEYHREKLRKMPAVTGDYVTIWKKQTDGSWKWIFDAGVPVQRKDLILKPGVRSEQISFRAETNKAVSLANEKAVLLEKDRAFSSEAAYTCKNMVDYWAETARLYREGKVIEGKIEASKLCAADTSVIILEPAKVEVSASADLSYTYGIGSLHPQALKGIPSEKFSYLHIWERQKDGAWKIVVDLTNPIPPKKD
jgi:ketosteroid isomerase-like protein